MKDLNENKKGYELTPAGWIPKDWEVEPFGEVFSYIPSFSFSREYLTNQVTKDQVYNIHYGDIHTWLDGELMDLETNNRLPFIQEGYFSEEELLDENFPFLKDGDLIIADASEDYNGVAECIEISNLKTKRVTGGLHTIVARDKNRTTQPGFRGYILKNPIIHNRLKQIATGISVYSVSKTNLSKLLIPIPSKTEQIKIAVILADWQQNITTTQNLILAKEQLKKGLMQQLLTGKKRLLGFNGEWKKLSAGEVFKNVSLKGYENEQLLSATQDKGIIPRSMLEARVTMPSGELKSFKLVESGDFVISLRSFQGGLEYSYHKGLVSPAYNVLKPKLEIDEEFYKYYFKSYDFIGHLAIAVIGIRDGKQISYDDFCTVRIPYPGIEEQKAIGKVFVTLDKEINLLKSQLYLYRQQKKGLMQVLLTGAVRIKI